MPSRLAEVINQYHVHDARDLRAILPPGRPVDVTVTSPPYWNLKDYGPQQQIGFGQTYETFLNDVESVFQTVFDVTKETGSLWIVVDTLKHRGNMKLLPFDIADRLQEIGWILQDVIIWQKDRTLPWSHKGKLRNSFEYIMFFSRSRRFKYRVTQVRDIAGIQDYWVRYPERYSPEGKTPTRTWDFPIPRQGSWGKNYNYVRHACPLPPALIDRILRLTTNPNDVVLDPFAGSGSVLAEAAAMGRRFIGTDVNRQYRRMFEQRVLPASKQRRKEQEGAGGEEQRRRNGFSRAIMTLRRLKYPKEVLRLYRNAHGDPKCTLVLAFPHRSQRDGMRLIFVFPSQRVIPNRFANDVQKLMTRPPLSKYGLDVTITTTTRAKIDGKWLRGIGVRSKRRLYRYRNGRFFSYDSSSSSAQLADACQNGRYKSDEPDRYPPVISTMKIRIDPMNPLVRG